MKVAIFSPKPSAVWVDKLGWVSDGFSQDGHDVRRCHSLADIPTADAECDLLLFDQNAGGLANVDLGIAAEKRAKSKRNSVWAWWQRDLVAMERDLPFAKQCTIETHGRALRAMDVVFVKERSMLDEYAAMGINARWLDQAATSEVPKCEHPERPEWDVLLFGCTSYRQRRDDARALADAGFRVLWLSSYAQYPLPPKIDTLPWTHPDKLPALASRCGLILGVDYRTDVPGYTSDRTYMAAGMGACYIARVEDYGADSGSLSPVADVAAWIYSDQEQLIQIVRTALADRDERERRGYASRERVMSKHTYKHRAAEICGIVDELRGKRLVSAAGAVS